MFIVKLRSVTNTPRCISLIDVGIPGNELKSIVISTGDLFGDDRSIIKNKYISVGLSRLNSDVGTFGSIRKRAHCISELLSAEIRGN